jgi:integrase
MAGHILRERVATGISKIHSRGCSGEGRCKCKPTFQAHVYLGGDEGLWRKHFTTKRDAEIWRGEQRGAAEAGTAKKPSKITFNEAADALLAGMRDGTIESRSGHVYRASTIRRYELALTKHLRPKIGRLKLSQIDRRRVKLLVADWKRQGMTEPSSIRNNLDPLRVVIREALEDETLTVDPMNKMKLPQGGGRRERVADRPEAEALLRALPASERALWATAFYGTLRRGELRALRWGDVDFDAGVIRVSRGWDDEEGEQAPKSAAGCRDVPLAGILRKLLVAHKLASGRSGEDLVFGRTATLPFTASTVGIRAQKAWKAAGLQPITLHEARHSAASYLIEAGLNDLELTAMVGHSDPRTTKIIYGHRFDDSGVKVAAKLDRYLEAAQ